ncbi:MAG TPA: hypothetical protein VEC57_05070 [Candidatus Limnocylindrales bacterium]|nr:hypothetical protein [Candidatus Limnocylindrales bacterium]
MVGARDRGRYQSDDRQPDVFEPDIVLPSQHFAQIKRKKFPSGEHRLLVALIQDAVECFQKHLHARDSKRRQLFLDAESWIDSEDDRGVFSFNNVCMLLGMNPDYVRQGLLAWRDKEKRVRRVRRHDEMAETRTAARIVPAESPQHEEGEADAELAWPEEQRLAN